MMLTKPHLAEDDFGLDDVRGGHARGLRFGRRLWGELRLRRRRLRLRWLLLRDGLRGRDAWLRLQLGS